MKLLKIVILLLIPIFWFSCMQDEKLWETQNDDWQTPAMGLFIVNEGNFMYNNASLSYYDMEQKVAYNDVFYKHNALPLGDVAQSINIRDSLAYIIVNNSGKIHIINMNTFKFVGKITGLTSPRYLHFLSENKAYVTDLYSKSIQIVNPVTYELIGKIDVNNHNPRFYQHATEQMVQYGKYVYTNCWSYDNKILIIDSESDSLVDSIEVGKQPVSLVLDRFQKIWTITDGGFPGSPYGYENPMLIRIDAENRVVEKIFELESLSQVTDLKINGMGDTLYLINHHIYYKPVYDDSLPQIFFENTENVVFTSLAVNPNNSEVYVANPLDHVQNGYVYRLSGAAEILDTFKVGIIPGDMQFVFR